MNGGLDPFAEVWEELRERLGMEPGLQVKRVLNGTSRRSPVDFRRAIADVAAEIHYYWDSGDLSMDHLVSKDEWPQACRALYEPLHAVLSIHVARPRRQIRPSRRERRRTGGAD
jgi:hypothetical protein